MWASWCSGEKMKCGKSVGHRGEGLWFQLANAGAIVPPDMNPFRTPLVSHVLRGCFSSNHYPLSWT